MKNTIKKLGISAAAAAMLFATSANAGLFGLFGGSFAGATEWTQLLNNGQLAAQTAKMAQQLQMQIEQFKKWQREIMSLKMMAQNIGQLPEMMKNNFLNLVLQMGHQMEQGQAIAYTAANIDQRFKQIFPGYDQYLQKAKGGNLDFATQYKQMMQTTKDTALNALKTLGIQERDLQNDQAFMSKLRTAMNTADGTEAAIAVANQLTYHQTQSLQKLQKTIMTQANLQAEWIAAQNQEDQMGRASVESFAKEPDDTHSDDRSPIRYQK